MFVSQSACPARRWPPSVQFLQDLFGLLQRTKEQKTRPVLMANYLGPSMLHHLGAFDWWRITNTQGVQFASHANAKCQLIKCQLAQLSTLLCVMHDTCYFWPLQYPQTFSEFLILPPCRSLFFATLQFHAGNKPQRNYTALGLPTANCKAESRSALRTTSDKGLLGVLGCAVKDSKGVSPLHKASYLHAMLPLHFHCAACIWLSTGPHYSALLLASSPKCTRVLRNPASNYILYETMDSLNKSNRF